jgi:hypothetical protein
LITQPSLRRRVTARGIGGGASRRCRGDDRAHRQNIAGIRRGDLIPGLGMFSLGRLSRQLHRLRDIGLIKRVAGTYRYNLTKAGRAATAAAFRITETLIIPQVI